MSEVPPRLILDTNVVIRGFVNPGSASGRILNACHARRVVPLMSRAILAEYRDVLRRPQIIARYPELNRPAVEAALEHLLYLSDYHRRVRVRFTFPRDPKDAPFLELAIAAKATHLITADRDMLELADGHDDAARRFRQRTSTSILPPEAPAVAKLLRTR